MKSNLAKKQLTMLTLVLALAVAVYLNWRFAKTENDSLGVSEVIATGNEAAEQSAVEEQYYGEAVFVSAPESESKSNEYFAEARLSRSQSRDSALDTLQRSLQKTGLTDAEKNAITAELSREASSISKETTIESLVKAKGFEDCVAFITKDNIKIIVKSKSEGLTVAEVSQIKETVLSQCEVKPENITIVEIK